MDFDTFFKQATGLPSCYEYQRRLAEKDPFPEVLDIPTGAGKTAAAVLSWLWRRRFDADPKRRVETPRRLVYCLPMRVLVEQTYAETVGWLYRLGMLAGKTQWQDNNVLQSYQPEPGESELSEDSWAKRYDRSRRTPIAVHLLMGGEDDTGWAIWPERDAILIGTQDMLLSRALNRGYAANRARWPLEFGVLNNDCLWIFDEVQLMGSGLATTAQLDAFRKKLWLPMFPTPSVWMSATLGTRMLRTKDREDWQLAEPGPFCLTELEKKQPSIARRLTAQKSLNLMKDRPKAAKKDQTGILDLETRERISLVILNTVPGAQEIFSELEEEIRKREKKPGAKPQPGLCLLHGRLRGQDRSRAMAELEHYIGRQDRKTGAVNGHPGFILVSTQVVEAGVDLSAVRLWSEVAPWPSIIQRLGRLNREGFQPTASAFFWMPKADSKGENQKDTPNAGRIGPYEKKDLEAGKTLFMSMMDRIERGLHYREALDSVMTSVASKDALRFEPEAVIRPDDLLGLFATEPDLAGGFTNISQFVRDQDRNTDVQVFWRRFRSMNGPSEGEAAPTRNELCSIAFFELKKFLGTKGTAWEWDDETERWQPRRAGDIQPGMTLMLAQSQGGYSDRLGWTGNPADKPTIGQVGTRQGDSIGSDQASESDWLTLMQHTADVEAEASEIVSELALKDTPEGHSLQVAATWHDVGKAHPKWQEAVHRYVRNVHAKVEALLADVKHPELKEVAGPLCQRLAAGACVNALWAKFADIRPVWSDPSKTIEQRNYLQQMLKTNFRSGIRHEAASALVVWDFWLQKDNGLTALAVYLVACHHGKVRTILRSTAGKGDVFGIGESDSLPPLKGYFSEAKRMALAPKYFGVSGIWDDAGETFTFFMPSWVAMMTELLGPGGGNAPESREAIPDGEPCNLGPFRLAYLEALLRAADVRASKLPGKGWIS